MKPNFLKRLWCLITWNCDMHPKNFMTLEQFKQYFEKGANLEELAKYLETEPYLECSKCGRVVK